MTVSLTHNQQEVIFKPVVRTVLEEAGYMKSVSEVGRDSVNWSAVEWAHWVAQRVAARKRTFLNEPEEMIGAYNRERSNMDDYRGRQILELLQNADDAGDTYGSNHVLIRYWSDGLCVANTGVPFSTGGVKSLMVGNYSPKKLARTKQIGNRGLGFRSVLSWTQTPFIISGNLRLLFNRSVAKATLDRLVAQSDELRVLVEEWQRGGHEVPIPTLACPAAPDGEGKTGNFDACEAFRRMWRRAMALRQQYDTVIALPFTESNADKHALEQVESLNPELMLFLQYLEELIIETEDFRRTWRAKREQDEVTVALEPGQEEPSRWRVYQRTGEVPEENLSPSERSRPAFEIKIAVPEKGGKPDMLFNYFPTKVRFPYPVVAHATMELTSNRQNLINSDANRYLVGQLAEALAEVAEQTRNQNDPWQSLKLLTRRGHSCDPMLEELDFGAALRNAAQSKKLVPRRDRTMAKASDVKRIPVDAEGWLPLEEFTDLALWTEDYGLKQTLEWLEVPRLKADEFRARTNRLSPRLVPGARAAFLAGFVRYRQQGFLPTSPTPTLLIDREDNIIEAEMIAYFPRTAEMSYRPPEWMPLRFVSPALVDEMLRLCGWSRERLVEELRDAGYKQVHAYDFGGVASAITSHVNRRCRENPDNAASIRCDGLRALRNLLESVPKSQRPKRDTKLRVLLPTRQGEWKNADELYSGEPYRNGKVMEALWGGLHPEYFVAEPIAFDGTNDASGWEPLILWLGVSQFPRQETITHHSWEGSEYLQHLRLAARYPMRFGEFEVTTPDDLNLSSVKVTTLHHIEEMLQASDPHAILAWLASDGRFGEWHREGDKCTEMDATFRVQTYRSCRGHPLPSYVLWLLRERAWLPTKSGDKFPPSRCLLAKTTSPELHEIMPCPAIDPEHPVFRSIGVSREEITGALVLIGVRTSLDDVSWEQCYELMLRLPEVDPTGKAATRLYRIVAGKEEQQTTNHTLLTLQKRFRESGKLWACTNGQWDYVPVQDGVYFTADATLPEPVTAAFPIIDLPRGRGADKMARVFGVRVLRSRDISLQVTDHADAANCEVLNDEVQRLKPYVLALRLDSTPEVAGIGLFKKLKVVACMWVAGKAVLNGRDVPFRLSTQGQSLVHDDRAYVVVSGSGREPRLEDIMLARHVASILSAVLQVERASDFAQLAIARDSINREALLADILGHDCSEVLAKAREVLSGSEAEEREPWPVDARKARSADSERREEAEAAPPTEESQPASQAETKVEPPIPTKVTARETPLQPSAPKRRIAQRVHVKRSSKDRVIHARRVTDGDRCEELAERFEESQGRFPLRVSSVQGTKGFGCDIVSFGSAAERDQFAQANGTLSHLVKRFIEVKGRSSARGSVPLAGNEKDAARAHGERYHIYRVYEAEAGHKWQVVELADPLAYNWEVTYDVDLFRRTEAQCWTVEAAESEPQETA